LFCSILDSVLIWTLRLSTVITFSFLVWIKVFARLVTVYTTADRAVSCKIDSKYDETNIFRQNHLPAESP